MRKEKIVTLQDREQKLTFRIREMTATRLESWMIRALLLLASSGGAAPGGTDLKSAGAFLAEHGLSALGSVDYDKAQPLLDELLGCCSRVVENVEERCAPETVDSYILDVQTLLKLRMEAIKLNLGFLKPGQENGSGFLEKLNLETR